MANSTPRTVAAPDDWVDIPASQVVTDWEDIAPPAPTGAAGGVGVQPQPTKPDIIDEQHPSVTDFDRFVIANTSTSPENSAAYIMHEHPELETQVYNDPEDGPRVLVRGRHVASDAPWRTISPKSIKGDVIPTVADHAMDAIQGLGSIIGTAAGGAGGMALGGPPGAVIGGMAGGAAAGGGLESLRQGLGEILGVNPELDPVAIGKAAAINGALGAIPGAGVGAGKSAAYIAEKGATAIPKAAGAVAMLGALKGAIAHAGAGQIGQAAELIGAAPLLGAGAKKAAAETLPKIGALGSKISAAAPWTAIPTGAAAAFRPGATTGSGK